MGLRKIFQYRYVVIISALALSTIGAYFSIYGISMLFYSKFTEASIMAICMEVCKIATVGALSLYWEEFNKKIKIALTSFVIILSMLTSVGIYSFLSSSYQENNNKVEFIDNQKNIFNNKKEVFLNNIKQLEKDAEIKRERIITLNGTRVNQERRLDSDNANAQYVANINIKNSDRQILTLQSSLDTLNKKILILNDSASKYDIKSIDLEKNESINNDVGTLKYLSKLTNIPMNKIVNILILFMLLVFDPLAIVLLASMNAINKFEKNRFSNKYDAFKKKVEYISDEKGNFKLKEKSVSEQKEAVCKTAEVYSELESSKQEIESSIVESEIIPKPSINVDPSIFNIKEDTVVSNVFTATTSSNEQRESDFKESSKKQSLYLQLLDIFYEKGKNKKGDEIPNYSNLSKTISAEISTINDKDIKDFLLICNLFKITNFNNSGIGIFEKDYFDAINLVSNI